VLRNLFSIENAEFYKINRYILPVNENNLDATEIKQIVVVQLASHISRIEEHTTITFAVLRGRFDLLLSK